MGSVSPGTSVKCPYCGQTVVVTVKGLYGPHMQSGSIRCVGEGVSAYIYEEQSKKKVVN